MGNIQRFDLSDGRYDTLGIRAIPPGMEAQMEGLADVAARRDQFLLIEKQARMAAERAAIAADGEAFKQAASHILGIAAYMKELAQRILDNA